jgi:hypothetical protein
VFGASLKRTRIMRWCRRRQIFASGFRCESISSHWDEPDRKVCESGSDVAAAGYRYACSTTEPGAGARKCRHGHTPSDITSRSAEAASVGPESVWSEASRHLSRSSKCRLLFRCHRAVQCAYASTKYGTFGSPLDPRLRANSRAKAAGDFGLSQ